MNQCLETYLRCMTMPNPKKWHKWLSLAQWWYNTSFHSAIKMNHFQALYGYPPPSRELSTQEASIVAAMEEMTPTRVNMDLLLQKKWEMAKHRMEHMADKKRTEGSLK